MRICFTILGEPASKANQRKLATVGPKDARRTIIIKSQKARNYERDARMQIPVSARVMLQGPVRVTLRIWYASNLPDLDESIVLDVLQARMSKGALLQPGVYRNDRQVREKHVFHGIDKINPRTEVIVEPMQAQQAEFPTEEAEYAF